MMECDSSMEVKSHCHTTIRRRARIFIICFFWAVWMPAASLLRAGNFYAGISPATVPWPGGIVPYEFTNTLTSAETNTYLNGLREWELAAQRQVRPAHQSGQLDSFLLQHQFYRLRVRRRLQPANGHRLQPEPRAGLPRDGPLVRLQPRKHPAGRDQLHCRPDQQHH